MADPTVDLLDFGDSIVSESTTTLSTPEVTVNVTDIFDPWPAACSTINTNYDPVPALASLSLFSIGLFFWIEGTKQYKSTLFLTGFTLGLILVFLICQSEDLLPKYGNVGVSTLAGVLYGLICYLVTYVGFFTVGFHGGLLVGLVSLVILTPIQGHSIWTSFMVLLAFGLFVAIVNVSYPSVTIITTPLIGSALMTLSIDYFLQHYELGRWFWNRSVKGTSDTPDTSGFCWYTWMLLGLWPVLFVAGIFLQWFVTAKGFRIPNEYGYKKGTPRRTSSANRPRLSREERTLAKYRYLYQVRTAGGDILAQSYVQSVRERDRGTTAMAEDGGSGTGMGTTLGIDTLSTNMDTFERNSNGHNSPAYGNNA